MPNFGFGYVCNVHIRSAGAIMNYFDFYSMQADSLHARVPISVLNSFLTKMLVRQVGHVTSILSAVLPHLRIFYQLKFENKKIFKTALLWSSRNLGDAKRIWIWNYTLLEEQDTTITIKPVLKSGSEKMLR